MISSDSELQTVGFLSQKEAASLAEAGFATVGSLLEHLPKRHEDRRRFESFPNQPTSAPVSLKGMVVDCSRKGFGKGRGFFEAVLMDGSGGLFGSGKITCRWFNMPFLHRYLAAGQELVVYGKVKDLAGRLVIDHPEFEVLREDASGEGAIHVDRIVPIYRNVSGISQRQLREILYQLVCGDGTHIPDGVLSHATSRRDILKSAHFPDTLEAAARARRCLALEEFFAIQLNAAWRKARHRRLDGRVLGRKTTLLTEFYQSLPFDLTEAQKRAIREIIGDMRTPAPMNRLLQGDVGAGKTFVAMAAMLLAVDSGCQAALMAPTQILAEQHYLTFRRWLEPLGLRIALKTANRDESCGTEGDSEAAMIIGTHALLHQEGAFRDLGFIVIDEQHKFGVDQRAGLIRRGTLPDVLVMTATPIPRTLAMTVYGDMDVSVLDEKPPGRGKVVTAVRAGAKQKDITDFVKTKLDEGRQVYLVYPLVEESESLKAESAVAAHAKWTKRLSKFEVGLLHGKLKPEEKEAVMEGFRSGRIHVLVATTVIEVGVDVPNATVMILHHAERFGLAQIHQLRGRIGRGGHKGYCILLTEGANPESVEKLSVLEKSADGFVIAEEDLRLRGPGDVLGTAQSGMAEFRFVDFLSDVALLKEARSLADGILDEDPDLSGRHAVCRPLILDPARSAGATASI